jgi:hypothetical protein
MSTIKNILLIAAIVVVGALFGASLYQSVIEGPNFNAGIPESLEHFRLFMGDNNPGNYFRVVAPAAQVLIFLSLILGWRSPKDRRWWLLAALILIIGVDVITFNIHYPRNALMFTAPLNAPVDQLKKAASEWLVWNHVRVVMILTTLLCTIKALTLNGERDIR